MRTFAEIRADLAAFGTRTLYHHNAQADHDLRAYEAERLISDIASLLEIGENEQAFLAIDGSVGVAQRPPCPHCTDGHDDPRRKPWGAFLATDVDSDGQPTHLIVSTSNGSHVAESDARWLRKLIREHRSHSTLPEEWDQ